jgi:RNA polymerase sigma-70 factor (family 1)
MSDTTFQITPDEELINALKASDELAMRRLHEMFYKPVCYFALGIVHNKQDAEDIVAEMFIKLWNKRSDFEKLHSIKSFLYITTKNACLNLIRDKKRRSRNNDTLLLINEPDYDYVLNRIVDAELHDEIRLHIEHLPKKPRRVLKELFYNEKKLQEVSEELNMLEQTVQTNKSRGLQQLRNFFVNNDLLPVATPVGYLLLSIYLFEFGK